ncbi:unnamed protein product [Caenorhabditis angaria]|uniref:Tubulin-specific chaperone D n=1 Tax=Caenorhabditis angaria TaxID=860376 RepID=A0A9P1I6K4_9PELO|nr:unnamed protein product [Caenorhabditis angaria]
MSEDDPNHGIIGCLPNVVDPIHVEELRSLVKNVREIYSSTPSETIIEISFLRYSRLLHLYQEQPNLLDSLIPELIDILVNNVELIENLSDVSRASLKYISELCIVRGRKTIVRLLPHQVTLLEPLLRTLEFYEKSKISDHSQRNVLLLWLWIVVRNPFDLRRFDPTGDPNNVITRIMNIALGYMKWDWNTSQYSASLVISQCLSRTDGIPKISQFLDNLLDSIILHESDRKLLLADLLILLAILKHVDRSNLVPHLEKIYNKIDFLYPIDEKRGSLIGKCLVKVVQRIGLIALKPRNCKWSYQRGKRLLDNMLNDHQMDIPTTSNDENMTEWNDEDGLEYPGIIEWSLFHILTSLSNSETSVRWSAAKGIGRITMRLPNADFALQVIQQIIDGHFGETGQYSSWHSHGACLAIAELARRGVLLPSLLETVIPAIENALVFEDLMGVHQNGNQVRDAACYVIWAFARTYDPTIMAKYLNNLASSLMCCALFDREVNLRRAASAAFQELAGRQKNVPNGITLLTLVDYFAVTNRQKCYEEICVNVAQFETYSQSILDHLINKKVIHWDEKIREQAGQALENICKVHNFDKFCLDILDVFVEKCVENSTSPIHRHGFLIATGHIVKALSFRKTSIPENIQQKLAEIPIILKSHTDRLSQVGSIIRKSVCRFIKLVSEANLKLSTNEMWIERILMFLRDTNEQIRELAKNAAKVYVEYHLLDNQQKINSILNLCLTTLSSGHDENERIGMCMISEILPLNNDVFDAICNTILKPKATDLKWATARKHAILAICSFSISCSAEKFEEISGKLFDTLYKAMNDYTTSAKGDIGRYVRESSMLAQYQILINANCCDEILDEHVIQCIRNMIQQSAERIGRTRETSCFCIKQLIESEKCGRRIANVEILRNIYQEPHDFIQDSKLFDLKPILEKCPEYYENILLGIVVSGGGLSEGTEKTARKLLLEHQRSICNDKMKFDRFLETCCRLFRKSQKGIRITNSFMQVLPQIFGNLGEVYEEIPEKSEAIVEIVEIMRTVSENSPQVSRQRLLIDCLAELLNCGKNSQIYRKARKIILESLVNLKPVLRKLAAEKLYEHLCCAEEVDELVLELLSTTNWQDECCEIEDLEKTAEKIAKNLA